MFNFYQKIDLPKLPENLIPDIRDIRKQDNICPTTGVVHNGESIFSIYEASQSIKDLYNKYIDFPHVIRWQVITDDLPLHYDWGHSARKYLYLIDQGGDQVTTQFFSEKENDPVSGGSFTPDGRELLLEISEELKSWHMLNVKRPHRVINITRPRIALIIREN